MGSRNCCLEVHACFLQDTEREDDLESVTVGVLSVLSVLTSLVSPSAHLHWRHCHGLCKSLSSGSLPDFWSNYALCPILHVGITTFGI